MMPHILPTPVCIADACPTPVTTRHGPVPLRLGTRQLCGFQVARYFPHAADDSLHRGVWRRSAGGYAHALAVLQPVRLNFVRSLDVVGSGAFLLAYLEQMTRVRACLAPDDEHHIHFL